jgi:hypothetical protein
MTTLLLWCFVALVSANVDFGILVPGYVANYDVKPSTEDARYTNIPIRLIKPSDGVTLRVELDVENNQPPGAVAKSQVHWKQWSIPNDNDIQILDGGTGGAMHDEPNVSSTDYFLNMKSLCTSGTCGSVIETALSAITYVNTSTAYWYWPPFELLDQRRTAKFTLVPKTWLYFWLAATDDLLVSAGRLNLYTGIQFWAGSTSQNQIQNVVYDDNITWPSGTMNVTMDPGVKFSYPTDLNQKGDWISPSPFPLGPGLWQVCFFNPLTSNARFTVKVGFNKPPTQAANLNASLNPLGFIALILICITAILKH